MFIEKNKVLEYFSEKNKVDRGFFFIKNEMLEGKQNRINS